MGTLEWVVLLVVRAVLEHPALHLENIKLHHEGQNLDHDHEGQDIPHKPLLILLLHRQKGLGLLIRLQKEPCEEALMDRKEKVRRCLSASGKDALRH